MPGHGARRTLPPDYDDDPARFAANQAATARYSSAGDVHAPVARRLADLGVGRVLDLGGGTGTLARELASRDIRTVGLDMAAHGSQAPRPVVRADLRALPFRDGSFDAAAALWVLYHLDDPRTALREASRVLRPRGWFVACASARDNDPELADVVPGWGTPTTFDAEEAAEIVGEFFSDIEVHRWDGPLVHLPDAAAVELFLRGRGADPGATARIRPPLRVTKRGCLVVGRRPVRPARRR